MKIDFFNSWGIDDFCLIGIVFHKNALRIEICSLGVLIHFK